MQKIRINITQLVVVVIISLVASQPLMAQVDAQHTQYFEIPNYYNPAAIGTTDFVKIRGGSRLQWIGIENAPQSFMLAADMPFKLFNQRFGVGLVLQHETMGLYKNMVLGAQLGYKFKLLKGEFTAGVQLGLLNETFKGTEVFIPDNDDYHESTDDAIPTTDVVGNAFDMAVGVFYSHKWFWTGISCTHLTSPTMTMNAESGEGGNEKNYEFKTDRTLYFMAGSNIPIKNTLFEVMPSLLVKSDFTFTTGEITARVRYHKFLSAGIGYRYDDAVMAMVGAEYKNFYLGYSYDYHTSAISKASSGSHEIVLGYKLKLDLSEKNKNKHKSIRIM